MNFVVIFGFAVMGFCALGEGNVFASTKHDFQHAGNNVSHLTHKVGHGVRKGAEKVKQDVKKGVGKVDHMAKEVEYAMQHVAADFIGDVEKAAEEAVKHLPKDIAVAWTKAKPFLEEAFAILNGVSKTLGDVNKTVGFLKMLSIQAI